MNKQNIEVEGGELLIQSKEGHYAIIPAKDRLEVIDMVKNSCDDCINNYIQALPKESDYAQDGSLIKKVKGSKLNPKNWGVPDYTDRYSDKDQAFAAAKKAGEKEYLYKGVRYPTDYAGTPRQEAGRYGVNGKPVHPMDLDNPIQVNRYNEIVSKYLPGHIEAGMLNPINRNILENSVNKSSSGKNQKITRNINHKGIGEKLYVYGADDYNPDKVTPGYNLLFNNCADATCDAFGLNKEGITTTRQTISKIKDKYQTIDVTGRTYSDYFAQWRDSKDNILENVDYWLGINSSPDINSTRLGKNIVRSIQKNLVKEGYSLPKSTKKDGTFDGIWGDETKNALLDYQSKNKTN